MPRRGLLDGLLLVLLVLLAFSSAVPNGWIWDDDDYVLENPLLEDSAGLVEMWAEPTALPQYYPLVHTTFWLEKRLWGNDGRGLPRAWGFHLDNVLIHALGALLLWRLLRRLEVGGAWFLAALFALHPVMVESVAWVSERKNVLSVACALGSACLLFDWHRDPRRRVRLALGVLLYLGALWSKTIASPLPLALLLVLWARRELAGRTAAALLGLTALGAWMGLRTAALEQTKVGAVGEFWERGFADSLVIAGRAVWFYLAKLLLPLDLVHVYPRWDVDSLDLRQWLFPLSALALPLGLLLAARRTGRMPLVVVLVFGGTLFPALGFLSVYPHRFSFVADHYQYHAAVAMLCGLGWLLQRWKPFRLVGADALAGPIGGRFAAPALAAWLVLLGALGAASWSRARVYEDSVTLWTDTVERNPGAAVGWINLAAEARKAEAPDGSPRQPDLDEAERCLRRAIEADPGNELGWSELGALLAETGRAEEAETMLRQALEVDPRIVKAHIFLGDLLRARGEEGEAAEHYAAALELNPVPLPPVMKALGDLRAAAGDTAGARRLYEEVIRLRPEWKGVRAALAALDQAEEG
jgi:tetratricopeptide (TPR) repeat protein